MNYDLEAVAFKRKAWYTISDCLEAGRAELELAIRSGAWRSHQSIVRITLAQRASEIEEIQEHLLRDLGTFGNRGGDADRSDGQQNTDAGASETNRGPVGSGRADWEGGI